MTKKLIVETWDDVKRLARMLCIQLQILICDLRLFQLKEQRFFLNRKIDVAYAKLTGNAAEVFRLPFLPFGSGWSIPSFMKFLHRHKELQHKRSRTHPFFLNGSPRLLCNACICV